MAAPAVITGTQHRRVIRFRIARSAMMASVPIRGPSGSKILTLSDLFFHLFRRLVDFLYSVIRRCLSRLIDCFIYFFRSFFPDFFLHPVDSARSSFVEGSVFTFPDLHAAVFAGSTVYGIIFPGFFLLSFFLLGFSLLRFHFWGFVCSGFFSSGSFFL